ncbi:hypothetical protein FOCC_FOCC007336 [Frankliniella occidentalis]|nr:hypothetical protein FOCC_FOCC007336 [Frankliniella occidentalis]
MGFLINIESYKGLHRDLVETHYLTFILTYKLSQDHIETYFSVMRARLDGATTSLYASSTAVTSESWGRPLVRVWQALSEFVVNIVEYFAGFVSRRVAYDFQCGQCPFALLGETSNSELFHHKDKGGLLIASQDVVTICLKAEAEIRMSKANKKMFTTNMLRHQINIQRKLPGNIFEKLHEIDEGATTEDARAARWLVGEHRDALIKAVIKKYLVVRVCSEVKKFNDEFHKDRLRKFLTNLTKFKGQ